MFSSIIAAALLMGAPAPGIQVDVGQVDSGRLPHLQSVDRPFPTTEAVRRVSGMLGQPGCAIAGQTRDRFDITVPYAVRLNPDGSANRVVVSDMKCPPLESFVGLIVLQMAENGDFRVNAPDRTRWYGSALNFNLQ
jgi:hypothetical protein